MQQKAPVSDAANMSASIMFDYSLNSDKSSNLNFHIQQTPFAAVILIKKTLVHYQLGQFMNPPTLDSNIVTSLKAENHELCNRIEKLEKYASPLKNGLEEELDSGEKGNLKYEKIVKEKEMENNNLKSEIKDCKISMEVLKSDIK